MGNRKAVLLHSLLLSIQPAYLAVQWVYNRSYFTSTSPVWLAMTLASWLFILTRLTLPVMFSPLRHVPMSGNDTFPLGHAWFMRDRQPPNHVVKLANETENEGLIAFWNPFYLRRQLIITSPEMAMEVVNTHNYDWEKPRLARKLLRTVLGEGLVNVEGNAHKAMRKSVAPAFSGRHIRDLAPLFWSKGLAFVDALSRQQKESVNGEVEISDNMSRVTLDIIGSAGIGIDFDTIHGDDHRLARLYATITGTHRGPLILFFLINVLLPPWFVRRLRGTVYARVADANLELRSCIRELLAEKKRDLKINSSGHKDILATIIRSGDFSDDYLCDQLLTFFAAGHDTTSSALTWTMMFLSQNLEIQDRLRAECQQHLSDLSAEEVTAETFDEMPYLTAVCNETLRLYPTVTITARDSAVDTRIGKYYVPKGTTVVIAPWYMNRHKTIWGEDAETFNPNRWLEGPLAAAGGAKSAYAFFTFLYGPRSCIGQGFARAEMKVLLAAMMLRFRFTPSANGKEIKIGGFVTIKPHDGLMLKLHDLKPREVNDEKLI